jgi:ADP-dependent NAD(P)H-hydrate dehydratase / NAD(P)H-hydrate epimerase
MIKVVSAQAMSILEAQAYQQGASEETYMENAGRGIAQAVINFLETSFASKIYLLVGKGNNGGDAFVAGRYLLSKGLTVEAIQLEAKEECSPLCQLNRQRFEKQGGQVFSEFKSFDSDTLILDGLFGTGFKGSIKAPYDALIQAANQSRQPILAIDIPSGLNGNTGEVAGPVIQATLTLYLELPKTGFFLNEGWNYVGSLEQVLFGLDSHLIDQVQADFELLTPLDVSQVLPKIKRSRHKYLAGYVVGLASSPSMPGAGLLSTLAAFQGGSGMVRLLHPKGMEAELSNSPYELIKVAYSPDQPQEVLQLMQKAGATFVGPGLGRTSSIYQLLAEVIPHLEQPCVLDADALVLFAQNDFKLPLHALFTPHTGEMQTLLGEASPLVLNIELLKTCQNYAEKYQITLILKGAPTFIFHPSQPILVNPTGDPGMATAGSGDVLTGFLASLLSQKLNCRQAALAGVYLHGLAGQLAAKERQSSIGMMASDIITHLAGAYAHLKNSEGLHNKET